LSASAATASGRTSDKSASSKASAPFSHSIVFGINEQGDAANLISNTDATGSSAQEQRSTKATPLNLLINGGATETEDRHVVAGEAFFDQRRRAAVFERSWTQRVETKNPRGRVRRSGDEAFRTAAFMVLAGVALQVNVEVGIAAIEGSAIMMLGEWRFLPNQLHGRVKPAFAARTRRAGAGGGFSSSLSTRRESRSDNFSCPASQIAREVEPLERRGARQGRFVFRAKAQFNPPAVGHGTRHGDAAICSIISYVINPYKCFPSHA
jgi:hypothetical protein